MVSTVQFVRDGSCGMDVTMVPAVSSLWGMAHVGWMLQWYQLYPVCEEGLMWDGCYNGISCIQFVRDGLGKMDVTMVSTVSSLWVMDVTMVSAVSSLWGMTHVVWMLQWYQLYPVCEEGLMWDGCYNGISCMQFVRYGSCGMDVTMVPAVSSLWGRAHAGWMLQWYQLYPVCEGWLR